MFSFFGKSKVVEADGPDPLPVEIPQIAGADIAAVSYGERQGGDLYDFVRVAPDRVLFGLMDIAGRVEENRKVVAAAQSTFRNSGAELFADHEVNQADAMVELCLRLNRAIMEAAGGVKSCPAFVGCYNEALGTICYTNAGHTPGLVRDVSGVSMLPATALPLGLFPYATTDAPMTALTPGAALLLVSRGIVEGPCRREEFGLERVKEAFQSAGDTSAYQIGTVMIESLQNFMCAPPTHNDVTALALLRAKAA
jgi:serine phosphatase RsbU (regulator of sigma subunit)